jgi:hypothetical protein
LHVEQPGRIGVVHVPRERCPDPRALFVSGTNFLQNARSRADVAIRAHHVLAVAAALDADDDARITSAASAS